MKPDIEELIKTGDAERQTGSDNAEQAFKTAEKAVSDTAAALAEFRWHWTRNKKNPDMVSNKDYATTTGKSTTQISVYARAWEMTLKDKKITLTDALTYSRLGPDLREATHRVSAKYKITPGTAMQRHSSEIRTVADEIGTARTAKADATKAPVVTATVVQLRPDQVSAATDTKEATKLAKGKPVNAPKDAAPSAPKLAAVPTNGEVVDAVFAPVTDKDTDEQLAVFVDALHNAEKEWDYVTELKLPADMVIERSQVLNILVDRVGALAQKIKSLMIDAETPVGKPIKKAQ